MFGEYVLPLFCFGGLGFLGLGYLVLSLLANDLSEIGEDAMGFAGDILQNVNIDILPESDVGGDTSFGYTGILSAFLAGFGVTGFVTLLAGSSVGNAVFNGLLAGIAVGVISMAVMKVFSSQVASSLISERDMIGGAARATTNSLKSGTAKGFVNVEGQFYFETIRHVDGYEIKRNDTFTVVGVEGGILLVK